MISEKVKNYIREKNEQYKAYRKRESEYNYKINQARQQARLDEGIKLAKAKVRIKREALERREKEYYNPPKNQGSFSIFSGGVGQSNGGSFDIFSGKISGASPSMKPRAKKPSRRKRSYYYKKVYR